MTKSCDPIQSLGRAARSSPLERVAPGGSGRAARAHRTPSRRTRGTGRCRQRSRSALHEVAASHRADPAGGVPAGGHGPRLRGAVPRARHEGDDRRLDPPLRWARRRSRSARSRRSGPTDRVVATYRGHGWALACGVPLDASAGRDLPRATGGSTAAAAARRYLIAPEHGLLGENSIVGAGVPIGAGVALAAQLAGDRAASSLVSIGDGAMNQGAVHEALVFAAADACR